MDITELTVHELQEKIKNKELTITEITKAYVDRMNDKEKDVQAFITELTEEGLKQAEEIQKRIKVREFINTSYDYCTGSHVGPDTIALFFMAADRELGGRNGH